MHAGGCPEADVRPSLEHLLLPAASPACLCAERLSICSKGPATPDVTRRVHTPWRSCAVRPCVCCVRDASARCQPPCGVIRSCLSWCHVAPKLQALWPATAAGVAGAVLYRSTGWAAPDAGAAYCQHGVSLPKLITLLRGQVGDISRGANPAATSNVIEFHGHNSSSHSTLIAAAAPASDVWLCCPYRVGRTSHRWSALPASGDTAKAGHRVAVMQSFLLLDHTCILATSRCLWQGCQARSSSIACLSTFTSSPPILS